MRHVAAPNTAWQGAAAEMQPQQDSDTQLTRRQQHAAVSNGYQQLRRQRDTVYYGRQECHAPLRH